VPSHLQYLCLPPSTLPSSTHPSFAGIASIIAIQSSNAATPSDTTTPLNYAQSTTTSLAHSTTTSTQRSSPVCRPYLLPHHNNNTPCLPQGPSPAGTLVQAAGCQQLHHGEVLHHLIGHSIPITNHLHLPQLVRGGPLATTRRRTTTTTRSWQTCSSAQHSRHSLPLLLVDSRL
jgi:hypothetical protein